MHRTALLLERFLQANESWMRILFTGGNKAIDRGSPFHCLFSKPGMKRFFLPNKAAEKSSPSTELEGKVVVDCEKILNTSKLAEVVMMVLSVMEA